jgi:hypothetical protein
MKDKSSGLNIICYQSVPKYKTLNVLYLGGEGVCDNMIDIVYFHLC